FSVCFINAQAPTDIYTLSLHDALPILPSARRSVAGVGATRDRGGIRPMTGVLCTISPQNGLVPGADFVRWNGAFGSPPEVQKYFERLAIPRLLDLPGPRTQPRPRQISDDEWLDFARV